MSRDNARVDDGAGTVETELARDMSLFDITLIGVCTLFHLSLFDAVQEEIG